MYVLRSMILLSFLDLALVGWSLGENDRGRADDLNTKVESRLSLWATARIPPGPSLGDRASIDSVNMKTLLRFLSRISTYRSGPDASKINPG